MTDDRKPSKLNGLEITCVNCGETVSVPFEVGRQVHLTSENTYRNCLAATIDFICPNCDHYGYVSLT